MFFFVHAKPTKSTETRYKNLVMPQSQETEDTFSLLWLLLGTENWVWALFLEYS